MARSGCSATVFRASWLALTNPLHRWGVDVRGVDGAVVEAAQIHLVVPRVAHYALFVNSTPDTGQVGRVHAGVLRS